MARPAINLARCQRMQPDDAAAFTGIGHGGEMIKHRPVRLQFRAVLEPGVDLGAVERRVVAFVIGDGPVLLAERVLKVIEEVQRLQAHGAAGGLAFGGILHFRNADVEVVVVVQVRACDRRRIARPGAVGHPSVPDESGEIPGLGDGVHLVAVDQASDEGFVNVVRVARRRCCDQKAGRHPVRVLLYHSGPGGVLNGPFRINRLIRAVAHAIPGTGERYDVPPFGGIHQHAAVDLAGFLALPGDEFNLRSGDRITAFEDFGDAGAQGEIEGSLALRIGQHHVQQLAAYAGFHAHVAHPVGRF